MNMDQEYYHPKTMTMKRKILDDNDFCAFSLCSPAVKIRRLDVNLPETENGARVPFTTFDDDSFPEEESLLIAGNASQGGLKIEELPDTGEDNHQAFVHASPSSSYSIDPQILSWLKKQVSQSSKTDYWLTEVLNRAKEDSCLAIVPWVPLTNIVDESPRINNLEMMDAEEIEGTAMEIEGEDANERGGFYESEALQQWQKQQHYMIPQPPNNGMTPIIWHR